MCYSMEIKVISDPRLMQFLRKNIFFPRNIGLLKIPRADLDWVEYKGQKDEILSDFVVI